MNEHLYVNAHGLRLIQEYEGAPRLKARLCEGNSFELSYGVTFDLNGNPFNADSTCTPEESGALFRNALELFERGVRELVTVPLNSNQFSGLTAFAWNVGLQNFAGSSVLRRVNENRMDDAAACFGMWIFATNGAGHKQAMRGLLRRRYSESALFMGYNWTQACSDDAIALQREIPDTLPGTDRVIYKTPFKDVLSVAQRYPLAPADELVLNTPAPPLATSGSKEAVGAGPLSSPSPSVVPHPPSVSPAPTVVPSTPAEKPAMPSAPSVASRAPSTPGGVIVTGPKPASNTGAAPPGSAKPPAQPPVIAGQDGTKPKSPWTVQPEDVHYKIDPGAGLKPLEDSDRAKAFYWQRTFMFVIYLGGAGLFGNAFKAGSEVLMSHAALMSVVLDLIVPLAITLSMIVVGAVGKSWADWRRHRAQQKASQGLY